LSRDLSVLIMAAGKGTRMRSQTTKVLHRLGGIPLLAHPIHLSQRLEPGRIVIIFGHQAEQVKASMEQRFGEDTLRFALQAEQNGTGHAVLCGQEALEGGPSQVLILSGDVPLLSDETLLKLIQLKDESKAAVALLSFVVEDPTGYGRILRDDNNAVYQIQEHRDCTPEQRKVKESNAGIYLVDKDFLFSALQRVGNQNDQGEYYLTDIVALAAKEGRGVEGLIVEDNMEVAGINDRAQLAELEVRWLDRLRQKWMASGVTMRLPHTIQIDHDVTIGNDTELGPNVCLVGKTTIGKGCTIGAGSYLENAELPGGTALPPNTIQIG